MTFLSAVKRGVAISPRIHNFSQFPSCSLGSNYPKSVEIPGAYNFDPGPRLVVIAVSVDIHFVVIIMLLLLLLSSCYYYCFYYYFS